MDRGTFEATVMSYKRRRPYQPFTLELVNGGRVEIDHPDAIALREGMAFYIAPGRIPHFFDHEGVCRIIGDLAGDSPE